MIFKHETNMSQQYFNTNLGLFYPNSIWDTVLMLLSMVLTVKVWYNCNIVRLTTSDLSHRKPFEVKKIDFSI